MSVGLCGAQESVLQSLSLSDVVANNMWAGAWGQGLRQVHHIGNSGLQMLWISCVQSCPVLWPIKVYNLF